jgi:ferric-dicitrate binding protein FerR (iron transport regulator)
MDRDMDEKLLIAERAAEWLSRLEVASADERAEFWKWLTESPLHVREVLIAKACDTMIRNALRNQPFDLDSLKRTNTNVRDLREGVAPWRTVDDHAQRPVPRRRVSTLLSSHWKTIAATVVMSMVAVTAIGIQRALRDNVTTSPGEWRDVRLADGTLLRAGPRTQVRVEMRGQHRLIHLTRGEVMVHVAKDSARPFFVETELATARAIGTAFAVQYRESNRVSVTVQEGTVGVRRSSRSGSSATNVDRRDSIVLRPGQRAQVLADGSALHAESVDVGRELAWVEGRLVFNYTLAQAIRELNLRNRAQIQLLDPTFSERRVVGIFDAADPIAFARTVERVLPLSVVSDEHGNLLLVPHPAPKAQVLPESRSH